MGRPAILIAGDCLEATDILASIAKDVVVHTLPDDATRESFFRDCASTYVDVKAIYRTNTSAAKIGTFDAELIEHLPPSVRCIAHVGAGYDQVDVHAALARNITVTHTPGAVDDATATTGMYLILSAFRLFSAAEMNARQGTLPFLSSCSTFCSRSNRQL